MSSCSARGHRVLEIKFVKLYLRTVSFCHFPRYIHSMNHSIFVLRYIGEGKGCFPFVLALGTVRISDILRIVVPGGGFLERTDVLEILNGSACGSVFICIK